jgi:hypothetical protein
MLYIYISIDNTVLFNLGWTFQPLLVTIGPRYCHFLQFFDISVILHPATENMAIIAVGVGH